MYLYSLEQVFLEKGTGMRGVKYVWAGNDI